VFGTTTLARRVPSIEGSVVHHLKVATGRFLHSVSLSQHTGEHLLMYYSNVLPVLKCMTQMLSLPAQLTCRFAKPSTFQMTVRHSAI
jgi:hypothetical protein